MQRRTLGKTGVDVSALGFGCAMLTGQPRAGALAVLEEAYEQGITHFDVARLYGMGWAEGILGEFLKGKRDRVTVTTKFGLQPPGGWVKHRRLVYAAKKVLGVFPPIVRLMRKKAAQGVRSGRFGPQDLEQSFTTSLRELGVDHVDVLLLHEAELLDAESEPLMRMLESLISGGQVRCVGIGSDCQRIPTDLSRVPALYQVIQFNNNARDRNLEKFTAVQDRGIVTHTVFGPAKALTEAAQKQPELARKAGGEIGVDLTDPAVIGSLLLHYALHSNADGMVLFGSMSRSRVRANCQDAQSNRYDGEQLDRFVAFVDAALGGKTHVH